MNTKLTNARQVVILANIALFISVLASDFAPLMILSFLFGACFFAIGLIANRKIYILSAFLPLLLINITFFDKSDAFFWCFVLAIPSIYTGYFLKEKYKDDNSYLLGSVIMSVFFLIFYKYFVANTNLDFWGLIEKSFEQAIEQFKKSNTIYKLPSLTPKQITDILKSIFPSIIIISSMIFLLISKYLGLSIVKRFKYDIHFVKPFRYFLIPRKIGLFFFIFYIIYLFLSSTGFISQAYSKIMVNNVLYIFSYMLMIQGLAILAFATHNIKSNLMKNLVIITTVLFFSYLTVPLLFLAIIDLAVDFRKIGFRSVK